MLVHACAGTLVCTVFLWEGMEGEVEEGMHLPYHSFWPPATETIWTRCQNLICEWKRPGEVQRDWNKGEERAPPFEKEEGRKRGSGGKREADKEAVEAERKVEVKECEIWHSTDSVVMGQGSSADL